MFSLVFSSSYVFKDTCKYTFGYLIVIIICLDALAWSFEQPFYLYGLVVLKHLFLVEKIIIVGLSDSFFDKITFFDL